MSTPYWLLGLPFDVTTLDEVRRMIFAAADHRQQLVFATPNVNFTAQAHRDPRFREDVLRTGLSLVDGMPVVWLGRLLGVPFSGRVAGSDLLESLMETPGPRRLRVFFFGGEQGASEEAMLAANRRGGGIEAVGAHYPGFASIEEMSDQAVIDAINHSNADLLVVALGAAKGHRWIEANRHRLTVPVISHLGAAINFIAGRLQRAPRFTHRLGLEWLWRIKEEPALLRRYARDGGFLLHRIVSFVIPEYLRQRLGRGGAPRLTPRAGGGGTSVTIERRFTSREVAALPADIVGIELRNVKRMDAAALGWLYTRRYRPTTGTPAITVDCDAASKATLRRWQAEPLLGADC